MKQKKLNCNYSIRAVGVLAVLLYCLNAIGQEVRSVVQTGHNAEITDYDISADGRFLATLDKDNKTILWNIKTGHQYREIICAGAKNIYFNSRSTAIVMIGGYSTSAYDIVTGKLIGYWRNTIYKTKGIFTDKKNNPQIDALKVKRKPSSMKCGWSKTGRTIRIRDVATNEIISEMYTSVDPVNWAATKLTMHMNDGIPSHLWWTGGQYPVQWDLKTGEIKNRRAFGYKIDKIWRDGKGNIAVWNRKDRVNVYRLKDGSSMGGINLGGFGDVHGLAFLHGNKDIVYDRNNKIWHTNLKTWKSDSLQYVEFIQTIDKVEGKAPFNRIIQAESRYKYLPKNKDCRVTAIGKTNKPDEYFVLMKSVYTPMLMKLGHSEAYAGGNTRSGAYDLLQLNNSTDIVIGGSKVSLMKNRELERQYGTGYEALATCANLFNNDTFVVGRRDGSLYLYEKASTKLTEIQSPHSASITSITTSPESNIALTTSEDKTVGIYRTDKKELVAYLITSDKGNEYIIRTPDNYYMSSPYGVNAISFAVGKDTYGFDQFDLKFNRPDIVLSRIGLADDQIISTKKHAYEKRLRRMKMTEDMISDEFHAPELTVTNINQLKRSQSTEQLLNIEARDSKYKLKSINVWINGVPLYGVEGMKTEEKRELSLKIPISLANGRNTVQVSCMNDRGAESYRQTLEIVTPEALTKPDLWIAVTGVSNYKDTQFNLTYATKDAKDVQKALANVNTNDYQNIHTLSLLDNEVTRNGILKIKEFFKRAGRNDTAILFYAGHGMVDNLYDYYLATYDTNFSNPSEHSLPYEEFESLLDGILPLKKLLFVDACHSGQIDKEDVMLAQDSSTEKIHKDIVFRSSGGSVSLSNKISAEQLDIVIAESFSNLQRGTGATVISSASGVQLARESDEWKNGLFSYCLINGLSDKKCDANNDGRLSISELQQYCLKQVLELSGGRQRPTSRSFNNLMNFTIGNFKNK